MNESRKRMRSAEDDYGIQTKFFVNEQLIEKSDPKLMKVVYGKFEIRFQLEMLLITALNIAEKTLNMIFNGAKLKSQKQQNAANNNVGDPMSPVLDSVEDVRICTEESLKHSSHFFIFFLETA